MDKQQRDHLQQFKQLIENLPESYFLIDKESRIAVCNKMAADSLGYTPEEMKALYLDDISADIVGITFDRLWEKIKKKGVWELESKHIRKNSHQFPVKIKAYYVNFGDAEYLSCIAYDISDIHSFEKNLIESSSLYHAVFDAIPDPLGILDPQLSIINYNQAAKKLLKISETNFMSKQCFDIVDHIIPCEVCSVKDLIQKKTIKSKEVYIDKLDKWLDIRAYPIYDNQGELINVIEHFRDITSHKRMESALRQNENLYRTLVQNSHDMIIIYQKGRIRFANQRCSEIMGYSNREIMRMNTLETVHPHDLEYVQRIMQKVDKNENPDKQINVRVLNRNGAVIHLDIIATKIKFREQDAYLVNGRDVTKSKEAEEKFYQTYIELTRSEEEKSLSHYVLDNALECIYLVNEHARFIRANEMALNFGKYEYPELKRKSIFDVFISLNQSEWKHLWKKASNKGFVIDEGIHIDNIGKVTHMELSMNRINFDNQDFMLIFARDITERKEAQEKIQQHLDEIERLKNRLEAENIYLMDEIKLNHNFEEFITQSDKVKRILNTVEKVASTDSTVMITGETGTGKELLARAIHNISTRKARPLVKVNCSALPADLIESELFGYEKGAFTGAVNQKIGRFELADGGTIFLDEIGELPLSLQPKLLRVIQEGEFERLGNPRSIKVNVRIISATNRDLNAAVEEKKFRPDLYYRLNVFPIHLPPLRERLDDLPLLISYFVAKYSAKHKKMVRKISKKLINQLKNYTWPGNVRELENIIERAIIVSNDGEISVGPWLINNTGVNIDVYKGQTLSEIERQHILSVMEKCGWRIRGSYGASEILGVKPTTLEARMKKLGITRP